MYAPDSWYEPYVEPETPADYGWIHEDDCPDIDHCEEMINGMIKAVYETGDISELESCLEEMAAQFSINLPSTDPILEKKNTNPLMSWYIDCQKKHISNMNNKEINHV